MEQHEFWKQTRAKFDNNRDLTDFKNWDVVRSIPLYTEHELVDEYAKEVKQLLDDSRDRGWHHQLIEPVLGHTEESYKAAEYKFPYESTTYTTTGFRLKSLHHILTFEKLSGTSINEYSNIVEFGAGIGDTARTILDNGFQGNYYVYDFPEISRLSSYYLSNKSKVIDTLPEYLEGDTLFIATWSLSEAPLDLRNKVAKWVGSVGPYPLQKTSYLILFQSDFYGTSNQKYFIEEWPFVSDSFYRFRPMRFHPAQGGNWYMVGQTY